MNDRGDGRPSGRRLRVVHQGDAVGPPPVGLAVWVSPAARAELVAAVDARLVEEPPRAALGDVRLELDAAVVRARWFDPPAARRLRRAAGMDAGAVALRVSPMERQALLDCDLSPAARRAVIGPHEPLPPRPAPRHERAPAPPERRTTREPVPLLVEQDGALTWTVGVADARGVLAGETRPDEATWTAAWRTAQTLPVSVDPAGEAQRLVTRWDEALSTAALTRRDLVDVVPSIALLLSLPQVVVLAPAPLATRVALHAYPTPVRLVPITELPPFPLP